jgi:hypothetical protein
LPGLKQTNGFNYIAMLIIKIKNKTYPGQKAGNAGRFYKQVALFPGAVSSQAFKNMGGDAPLYQYFQRGS